MPNDVLKENEVKPGLRVKIHPSSMFSFQTPLAGTVLHDNGDDEEYFKKHTKVCVNIGSGSSTRWANSVANRVKSHYLQDHHCDDEEERDFIWYHVRFDDGYSNDYRHFDLMHADTIPANNKQAAILLKTTLSE